MDISPAKSLDVVSDSEGEEDTRDEIDMLLEREPNAARLPDPRDWHSTLNAATIATNSSSHISQFSTPFPGHPLAMANDSSAIQSTTDPDLSATKRARPRPRMRPIPPPDDVASSSIDAFPTLPPAISGVGTIASFDNSIVQGVPAARPPSLPPSSLPSADSSSMIAPTFPIPPSPQKSAYNARVAPAHNATPMASSSLIPGTVGADQPAPPKRPRPKMRPPPPPDAEPVTATTSTATTSSSNNASTSTRATTASSAEASRRSALDDALEFTGRGARGLMQQTKSIHVSDPDVDVGGPEDAIINLLDSSDGEYGAGKAAPKPKAKPKPKPKKKDASKVGTPIPSDAPTTSAVATKRKSPHPQTSDDELGRWDNVPHVSASSNTKPKKRKKIGVPASDDESAPPRSTVPAQVPNTIDPPPGDPPSSPLTDIGRSPEGKRRGPPEPAADETAPSPAKKQRKSGGNVLVGVVLQGPPSDDNGKRKRKKSAKAAAREPGPATGDEQAFVPPALGSVADTSLSGLHSESSKTKSTPPTSSGASLSVQPQPEPVHDPAPMDTETAAPTKKQPKKRAPKGKKGAATEDAAATDEQPTPAPKKSAKGKKAKGAEPSTGEATPVIDSAPVTSSSNPDAGVLATSSNPSADAALPTSSNEAAQAKTPAPKPKPKPRHSATPASMPVAMGASGSLLRSTGGKSSDRPLSETIRMAIGGSSTPSPRVGLSRRGSSKIAPLLAFRGVPPPPPPPMPKKPVRKKKGDSDDEDDEEGPEWEGLTEKQKEKKRREKEMAAWYSD